MIRLLLVDDQPLVRAGLKVLLGDEPGIAVVGEAQDGLACLAWLETDTADVVLLDIRMPGMNGIQLCRMLTGHPQPRVVLLTTFDDEREIAAGLNAGAGGFLLKDASAGEIAQAVRVVAAGGRYIQRQVSDACQQVARVPGAAALPGVHEPLTAREFEVLALVARGMSNKRIAIALNVAENTVKVHVARILQKLGAQRRLEAVRIALRLGSLR